VLEAAGIPVLPTPERVGRAAGTLARYAETRRQPPPAPPLDNVRREPSGRTPDHCGALSEVDGKRLLSQFRIPVTRDVMVRPGEKLRHACKNLAFPVVAKIVSPDIAHKTDLGAVRVGIGDLPTLETAATDIVTAVRKIAPTARIEGILVSEMITDAVETLVGVINDPSFGPTVALGLGGVLTEVLGDVTYRVAPFDLEVARKMIDELRGSALLRGVRGKPPLDIDALAQALVDVSRMAWDLRDRLLELDINPLFVRHRGHGVAAADCLAVMAR
jgi:acyl-CoA synthetase (NDP forming)